MTLLSRQQRAWPLSGRARLFWVLLSVAVTLHGCSGRELRGRVKPSADKGTYLVVEPAEAPGMLCPAIFLDGKRWPHAPGRAGKVSPGEHWLDCAREEDGGIGFIVPEGKTFHFDYWGP